MNKKQKVAIIVGMVAFVGMILIPPWVIITPRGSKYGAVKYCFIWSQPKCAYSKYYQIDYARLAIELGGVVAIAGAVVGVLKRSS